MTGRQGKRHQQVFAFVCFGNDRAISNLVGTKATAPTRHFAFASDHSVFDDPANFMHVGAVRSQPDRVRRDLTAECVVLGQDQIADHAAALANVELMRPAARVGELVLWQAEPLHVLADFFRDTRIGRQKVQQTAMVVLDLASDLYSPIVARFRPLPARSGQVAAERRGVEIPLLIGQWIVLAEPAQVHVVADRPTGFDEAGDEFETRGVIVRRWSNGQPIVRRTQTQSETVSHDSGSRLARRAWFALIDQWQQTA